MNRKMTLRRKEETRKLGVLLAGGLIGALTGIGAAYLLLQARETRSRDLDADLPILSSGGAAKLGLLLIGFLRQISDIASGR
jgi:hypothetical protein